MNKHGRQLVCAEHRREPVFNDRHVVTPIRGHLENKVNKDDDEENDKDSKDGFGRLTRRGVVVLSTLAIASGVGATEGIHRIFYHRNNEKVKAESITDNVPDTRAIRVIIGRDVDTVWEAASLIEGIDPRIGIEKIKEINPNIGNNYDVEEGKGILVPNPDGNILLIRNEEGEILGEIDLSEIDSNQ